MSARACLCVPSLDYLCHLHRSGAAPAHPPETIEESDSFTPDHRPAPNEARGTKNEEHPLLAGYGHRRADQDGGDGEEWVMAVDDKEAQFFEALRILFDAEVI